MLGFKNMRDPFYFIIFYYHIKKTNISFPRYTPNIVYLANYIPTITTFEKLLDSRTYWFYTYPLHSFCNANINAIGVDQNFHSK